LAKRVRALVDGCCKYLLLVLASGARVKHRFGREKRDVQDGFAEKKEAGVVEIVGGGIVESAVVESG